MCTEDTKETWRELDIQSERKVKSHRARQIII